MIYKYPILLLPLLLPNFIQKSDTQFPFSSSETHRIFSNARIFSFSNQRQQHETSAQQQLKQLATISQDDMRSFNQTLKQIMVPRVSDTPSHANVRNFIENYLRKLNWLVEQDQFEDDTPLGKKRFTNIIATLNPQACKRVVLACHYDSKYFLDFEFLAATDSAVPCTMILELIKKLDPQLKKHKSSVDDVTLQVIFFDGEEAFHQWSNRDSLYGSRHLAARLNSLAFRSNGCGVNLQTEIDRIKVLILLDLIGEANPRFCSYYRSTQKMFDHLRRIEQRLNQMRLMESRRLTGTHYFSRCSFGISSIEDDHIPFEKLGVSVLHIIATPFPLNWHLEGDDGRNLHHPTINNLMKIFRIFLLEELKLL